MVVYSKGVTFEALTGQSQQFGRHGQVTLGTGDMHVSEVRKASASSSPP